MISLPVMKCLLLRRNDSESRYRIAHLGDMIPLTFGAERREAIGSFNDVILLYSLVASISPGYFLPHQNS